VAAVAGLAAAGRLPHLVVDPVMVASSGARLLEPSAERAYVELLLPHTAVLTPNLLETQVLLGGEVRTLPEQREAARALGALGPRVVVVKGGHAVADAGGTPSTSSGTGRSSASCAHRGRRAATTTARGAPFAATVAARLAHGDDAGQALRTAKDYVARAMAGAAGWRLGAGPGPLDHQLWGSPPTSAPTPSP
jgi:hydroxymethylpyrimidine/phosphomethylpyrimidine kinase